MSHFRGSNVPGMTVRDIQYDQLSSAVRTVLFYTLTNVRRIHKNKMTDKILAFYMHCQTVRRA